MGSEAEKCEHCCVRHLFGGCCAQRGCSQGTLWRLAAEAVLEVSEVRGGLGVRELRFHMIEGDFKACTRSRCCADTLPLPELVALIAARSGLWLQTDFADTRLCLIM